MGRNIHRGTESADKSTGKYRWQQSSPASRTPVLLHWHRPKCQNRPSVRETGYYAVIMPYYASYAVKSGCVHTRGFEERRGKGGARYCGGASHSFAEGCCFGGVKTVIYIRKNSTFRAHSGRILLGRHIYERVDPAITRSQLMSFTSRG